MAHFWSPKSFHQSSVANRRVQSRVRHHGVGVAMALLISLIALGVGAMATSVARAAVTPRVGFRATVLGWSSWYGSYDLGLAGVGWCIDHGLHAPDPAFRYLPAVPSDLSDDQRAAMAWAVTAHVNADDPIESAAVMLVLHDLRGASYPLRRLDVDTLTPNVLSEFGGHENDIITTARARKAEALAHQHLRAPFSVRIDVSPPVGGSGQLTGTVVDATGTPVEGAGLSMEATGVSLSPATSVATRADGSLSRSYSNLDSVQGASFRAHAIVPDPALAVLASSTMRAQRVAHAGWIVLDATRAISAPTTTTTAPITTSSTTTSSIPPTTSTTSSTIPPTTSTTSATSTTVAAPTSTTMVAEPTRLPSTTTSESPSAVVAGVTRLPVTGGRTTIWAMSGFALILIGAGAIAIARRRVS